MAKLIFSLDNTLLSEFVLDRERMSIGRRPTNEIHIDNLAVSGEHAVIIKNGNDFYIEDQDSTNGTEVNGKLIKNHLLKPGDLIQFGKYQLKYVNEEALQQEAVAETDFEKTMMIRPAAVKAMNQSMADIKPSAPSPVLTTPTPSTLASAITPPLAAVASGQIAAPVPSAFKETGRIQVLNGSNVGRELVLNKALTTLGKTGVQVAVITKRPQGYFITHVEGKVFPIVNGKSTGLQAVALADHDVIELAGVKMEFYLDKV